MSNDFDPLEQELANLKPREPSPELRQLVGNELRRPTWARRAIIGAVALGFSIATGIIVFHELGKRPPPPPRSFTPAPPTLSVPNDDESQPTLQAYRRAIGRSPEELDALLDKHAAAGGESTSFRAFSRPELVSLGEP